MRRRRALLVLAATSFLAGCNRGTPTGATSGSRATSEGDGILNERDPPSSADRPTTERPVAATPADATDETVSPIPYPDRPASYASEPVATFVEEYERAHRRNALLGEYGGSLIGQGTYVDWVRTLEASDTAGTGQLQYRYSASVDEQGDVVISDSATIVVTYYVDDSLVVRAEATGRREQRDELDPDPWETGDVLTASQ